MRRQGRFLVGLLLTLATTLVAVHPMLPAQALRDRKALLPTEDSEVRSVSPDFNFGRARDFQVRRNSEEILSFLMFDLSQVPSDAAIEEATLRLYAAEGTGTSTGEVNAHHCPSNDWTEDGITYNNRPAFQPVPVDSVNVTSNSRWYEWNITNTAISTFSRADKRLSLALEGYTHGGIIVFYSRQSPAVDRRPELSVLYSYTPSSGIDPALVALVVVVIAAASAVGLQLVSMRRKKRKQP